MGHCPDAAVRLWSRGHANPLQDPDRRRMARCRRPRACSKAPRWTCKDGFIHLSAAHQVRETAARHFAGQRGAGAGGLRRGRARAISNGSPRAAATCFRMSMARSPTRLAAEVHPLPLENGAHRFPPGVRMSLASLAFPLARPLLHALDAETAHGLTIRALKALPAARPPACRPAPRASRPSGSPFPIRWGLRRASTRMPRCRTRCWRWASASPRSAR